MYPVSMSPHHMVFSSLWYCRLLNVLIQIFERSHTRLGANAPAGVQSDFEQPVGTFNTLDGYQVEVAYPEIWEV